MDNKSLPATFPFSMLLLRLAIAVVMIVWTADKIINPDHARGVFVNFYGLDGLSDATLLLVGAFQAVVVLMFMIGALKTVSYGAVLLMHGVSTLSSWRQYLDPFENLLFFAAWPMLAACVALFLMRDYDQLLAFGKRRSSMQTG